METVSFLALLWAMFTERETAVSVIGAVHGVLFLAYALLLWVDRAHLGWSTRYAIVCIVTGPVGAIIVLERLKREGSLR